MADPIATKERLAGALQRASAPSGMVRDARAGLFDDFESPSATPIRDLVALAETNGLTDIARRARDGEFDSTAAEARAWASSVTDPETRAVLRALEPGAPVAGPWTRDLAADSWSRSRIGHTGELVQVSWDRDTRRWVVELRDVEHDDDYATADEARAAADRVLVEDGYALVDGVADE